MTDNYQSLLEEVKCNLCGSDAYETIYPPHYELAQPDKILDNFRSSGDELLLDRLVRCRRCGLMYLNPRLNQALILKGYSSGADETFISQNDARERTFTDNLAEIERLVPGKGRILDVGTAGGAFLGVAKRHGWEVAGCEPNRWLAEWGSKKYGLEIKPGTIFDLALPAASFDVVTLWDVLEHTTDPKKVLIECNRVLKQNGLLIVNYPDINSMIARLMGKKWVFLLSVHLYYFTFETIGRLLADCGFTVTRRKNYWQKLELDYILFRMEKMIPLLPSFARQIVKLLKLQYLQIPYWMGQVLVLARKEMAVIADDH